MYRWTHDDNGDWWYYNHPVNKNESTTNLITKATLTRDLDMSYVDLDSSNACILVYEETVESYNAKTPQEAFTHD